MITATSKRRDAGTTTTAPGGATRPDSAPRPGHRTGCAGAAAADTADTPRAAQRLRLRTRRTRLRPAPARLPRSAKRARARSRAVPAVRLRRQTPARAFGPVAGCGLCAIVFNSRAAATASAAPGAKPRPVVLRTKPRVRGSWPFGLGPARYNNASAAPVAPGQLHTIGGRCAPNYAPPFPPSGTPSRASTPARSRAQQNPASRLRRYRPRCEKPAFVQGVARRRAKSRAPPVATLSKRPPFPPGARGAAAPAQPRAVRAPGFLSYPHPAHPQATPPPQRRGSPRLGHAAGKSTSPLCSASSPQPGPGGRAPACPKPGFNAPINQANDPTPAAAPGLRPVLGRGFGPGPVAGVRALVNVRQAPAKARQNRCAAAHGRVSARPVTKKVCAEKQHRKPPPLARRGCPRHGAAAAQAAERQEPNRRLRRRAGVRPAAPPQAKTPSVIGQVKRSRYSNDT